MKTSAIQFDTQKSLDQIASILRGAGEEMERIKIDDPLEGMGRSWIEIAVVISGYEERVFGVPIGDKWGVQVFVTDTGNARHVELVALGQNLMLTGVTTPFRIFSGRLPLSAVWTSVRDNYKMEYSVRHRNEIANMLRDDPSFVREESDEDVDGEVEPEYDEPDAAAEGTGVKAHFD